MRVDGTENSLETGTEIARAVLDGRLTGDSLVFHDTTQKWIAAKNHPEIRGLFLHKERVTTQNKKRSILRIGTESSLFTWLLILLSVGIWLFGLRQEFGAALAPTSGALVPDSWVPRILEASSTRALLLGWAISIFGVNLVAGMALLVRGRSPVRVAPAILVLGPILQLAVLTTSKSGEVPPLDYDAMSTEQLMEEIARQRNSYFPVEVSLSIDANGEHASIIVRYLELEARPESHELVYSVTISGNGLRDLDDSELVSAMEPFVYGMTCNAGKDTDFYKQHGLTITYLVLEADGRTIGTVSEDSANCE